MKWKTVAWIVCGILVGSLALVGVVKLTNNDSKLDDEPQYTTNDKDYVENVGDGDLGDLNVVPLTD